MKKEVLEVEIDRTGMVKVKVQGRKGPACLDIRDILSEVLGPVESVALTDEYYEEDCRVTVGQETRARRK